MAKASAVTVYVKLEVAVSPASNVVGSVVPKSALINVSVGLEIVTSFPSLNVS